MKTCPKCGVEKPFEFFSRNASKKDGRSAICKKCHADINKAYRQSERGRAVSKAMSQRYENSEKGKAVRKAQAQSEGKKAAVKKYRQSERGIDTRNKSQKKRCFIAKTGIEPPDGLLEVMVLQSKIRRFLKEQS